MPSDRPLVWLHGEVKSPPFSHQARLEAGDSLRCLQEGNKLALPFSRPLPSIGPRVHELRIQDANVTWRIIYRLDPDAVVVVDVFHKQSRATPPWVITACIRRLRAYDRAIKEDLT
jgi:phage-related protein